MRFTIALSILATFTTGVLSAYIDQVTFYDPIVTYPSTAATHSGEGTYYTPGLGACGKTNSASDLIVAVSASLYDSYPGAGPNPNKNPICKRKIKATVGGNSVVVSVVDRCVGCAHNDLDFSPTAFKKLAPLSKGRINIKWDYV